MKNKTAVIVMGAEHSGTRYVHALLSVHPEIKSFHYSIPSAGKVYEMREIIEGMKTGGPYRDIYIVYVTRDRSCTLKSQEKSNSVAESHLEMYNAKDGVELADNFIKGKSPMFVSYETIIRFRDLYLSGIFHKLGVGTENYDYSRVEKIDIGYDFIDPIPYDANEKYIK